MRAGERVKGQHDLKWEHFLKLNFKIAGTYLVQRETEKSSWTNVISGSPPLQVDVKLIAQKELMAELTNLCMIRN